MKKFFVLLLALCLLVPLFAAAEAADGNTVYASDFSDGMDGWYPRSAGGAKLGVTADGLLITGRAGDWHSPGRDFDLTPGVTYYFAVDVQQTSKDSADFILSVAHTKNGTETYENLGFATVPHGEWTTLYGTWTAAAYDKVVLYIETSKAPMMNFSINHFTASLSDPRTLTPVSYEGDLPVLREVYAGKFDVGTCMSQFDVRSPERAALVASQYSIITPENELKPDAVLDRSASRAAVKDDETAVAVHFDSALPILNFARDNGLKVHGHVLVWHSQTPEWFFHEGYDEKAPYVTREVMIARLDNYMRLVFAYMDEHFPGLFVSWDVVNEAVADGSSSLRASNWTKVVGQDFINVAFELADKYAPANVLLCYNDYSTPYEPKLTGIYNVLESLVADGHIDGFGFQTHYSAGEPSVAKVAAAYERIAPLGLRLRVSEMDVGIGADNDANREAQATYFADLMGLFLNYADQMEAVQFWGVSDGTSWIAEKHPLLFDAALQPKPAFFAVVDAAD